jgi:hypothetical protein
LQRFEASKKTVAARAVERKPISDFTVTREGLGIGARELVSGVESAEETFWGMVTALGGAQENAPPFCLLPYAHVTARCTMTSRTQVDRILDPKNDITLGSLQRAAAVVGRRVTIELV